MRTRAARLGVRSKRASCVDEPPPSPFAVVVDIGVAVGEPPEIECPPGPYRLQSFVKFAKNVVIAEEGGNASGLARRSDCPVVIPPVCAHKLGTVKRVGAAPLPLSVGRSAEHA